MRNQEDMEDIELDIQAQRYWFFQFCFRRCDWLRSFFAFGQSGEQGSSEDGGSERFYHRKEIVGDFNLTEVGGCFDAKRT